MLDFLDKVIDKVLDTGWVGSPKPTRSFEVPDENFSRDLTGLTLNIYLVEIRENKDFRRASWDSVEQPDGRFVLSQPPAYYDCHYLISAWSQVQASGLASPTAEEHAALGGALLVLNRNPDVVPSTITVSGGGQVFQQAHIYLSAGPPETPRVVNDFWSTMKQPWRPTISLIATAPLDYSQDLFPAPPLVTLVVRTGFIDAAAETFDESIEIGGFVLQDSDGKPILGADVLRIATGEQVKTDSQGRFIFAGLSPGKHRLRASASNLQSLERELDLPNAPLQDHVFRLQ